jgi:hypothetical protein
MGYGLTKIVKMSTPADVGIAYAAKSEPGDVPKQRAAPQHRFCPGRLLL